MKQNPSHNGIHQTKHSLNALFHPLPIAYGRWSNIFFPLSFAVLYFRRGGCVTPTLGCCDLVNVLDCGFIPRLLKMTLVVPLQDVAGGNVR